MTRPCTHCGSLCSDSAPCGCQSYGAVHAPDNWPDRISACDQLADLVDQFNRAGRPCSLKATVGSVVKENEGTGLPPTFTININVTGNTGPVAISLNKRTYTPGTSVSGVRGYAVVVYLRQQHQPKCQTAVFVELEKPQCVKPDAPQIIVTNTSCAASAPGLISLRQIPPGVVAVWYPLVNGTGQASASAPAYVTDRVVSGSVRYRRLNDPNCFSEPTPYVTSPADCSCSGVAFGGTELPVALVGQFFKRVIPLTGTAPFGLGNISKPTWLSAQIDGRDLVLSGTPRASDILAGGTISVTVLNCTNKSSVLNAALTVSSTCSQVDSDWEVLDKHCRVCSPTPVWRVASIRCLDTDAPVLVPCTNNAPAYKIVGIRCDDDVTNPCAGITARWKVTAIKCSESSGVPGDPCAGVTAAYKVSAIRCSGTADTTVPPNPCAGVTAAYKITSIHCQNS